MTILHGKKKVAAEVEGKKELNSEKETVTSSPTTAEGEKKTSAAEGEKKTSALCTRRKESSGNMSFQPIISVWLCGKNNSEKRIRTYALIDTGSNVSFISNSVCKELNLHSREAHLKLSTVHGTRHEKTSIINDIVCIGASNNQEVFLPEAYVQDTLPLSRVGIPSRERIINYKHLECLKDEIPALNDDELGLIIGTNCPKGVFVERIISQSMTQPQGFKFPLGWTVIGPTVEESSEGDHCTSLRIVAEVTGEKEVKYNKLFVCPIQGKEILDPKQIERMFELEYVELTQGDISLSVEDKRFLEICSDSFRVDEDNHIELALPLRKENLQMPNSRQYALCRLRTLKRKFLNDPTTWNKYKEFINDMILEGHAELVPDNEISRKNEGNNRVWYIPHFGIYHPKKPEKLRVVFDCAAKFHGVNLNENLLSGPDLNNTLLGVLLRFRMESVAVIADIKGMFHQVRVVESDRDLLRFLWFKDNDINSDPVEMRMRVHLFGATSSPSCAIYALQRCAELPCDELYEKEQAQRAIRKNMYVDDLLKSCPSVEKGKELIHDITVLCANGGFELTKFNSNIKEVRDFVPEKNRAESSMMDLNEFKDIPIERALGVFWCIENDSFGFRIILKDQPLTRRGILATVSSIYDPIGFCAPITLIGKRVLQRICKLSQSKLDWDEPIPEEQSKTWLKWRSEIVKLNDIEIERCHKPKNFGDIKQIQFHHFGDATPELGIGQCSYMRLVNSENKVHCSFLMGKSRVPPLKSVTVPRLELHASLLNTRISKILSKELEEETLPLKDLSTNSEYQVWMLDSQYFTVFST